MKYNTYTLDNGLRIIHLPSDSKVVYCGYQINAGTRNEEPGEEGLAHFCEHVTFKGTERRKAWHILNCLESVGGDLNAYTNKEGTVYYSAILKEHIARAVDLLTDIVFHSVYPQAEIDKEVEVICDEIESYNDSPAELIYDEFENIIFKGSPLGHNILGTAEQVRSFKTEDALRFTRKLYRPDNAIFFAYGDIDFKKLVKLIRKALADDDSGKVAENAANSVGKLAEEKLPQISQITQISGDENSITTEKSVSSVKSVGPENYPSVGKEIAGQTIVMQKNTHQAHVMIGTRAYDVNDSRRMPLYLLNNMLGGPGMNAKLNLALRERNGLVYTVESTMVAYGDTGIWSIYFGCDEHDVKRCLRLVRKELDKFMQKPLSEAQLKAAKKQIKGQVGVACDNRENFALDFGKSFLHYGWEKNVDRLYEQVDEITAEQIQAVAQELFDKDRLTTLIFR
ncbi:insulinase family protein [Prevotella copri]|uniref:Insulinase family protein n=1 Tax=Segatella copri TaxID=165179 RepID=A0A6A7VUK8_9BACT|nr:pitrilysin family protein [Segatella copri]MQM56598.1 insulinase family protein [Segatella copri]MQN05749.1 insulinase family protein [Segatella copri]MQN08542.1 insulinase family protein [Segatella copri]MQO61028.1 insulinase family protein [Segatella copri]MQO64661.1 insulinase family protein [Segatella copri]